MAKEVYFVVAVDLSSKSVYVDQDVLDARFPDGSIWNGESGEWEEDPSDVLIEEALVLLKKGLN